MFFAKKQESETETSNKTIHYNYYNTKIYKNQYEKTIENGGYIKIPFINASSTTDPNLIYNPTQSKYATKNIYIVKKTHLFPGNHDGELIIEHVPITNSDAPVYSCILLKTKEGIAEETAIDKIINQSFDPYLELRLNDFVQLNTICMVNSIYNVFLFPSPILISSRLDNLSSPKDTLFSNYNETQYTKIPINAPHVIEGLEIIDCVPVDINDKKTETVEMTTVGGQSNTYLITIINFLIFTIMTIAGWLGIPILYDYIKNKSAIPDDKINTFKGFITICLTIFTCIAFSIGITGISIQSNATAGVGWYLFIFTIMSMVILAIKQNFQFSLFELPKITQYMSIMNKPIIWWIWLLLIVMAIVGVITVLVYLPLLMTQSFNKKNKQKNKQSFNVLTGFTTILVFYCTFVKIAFEFNFNKNPTTWPPASVSAE